MKRIIYLIILTVMLLPVQAEAQSINWFFSKYDGEKHFESITIGRFLFTIALISGNLKNDEKELIGGLKHIKILTAKDDLQPEFSTKMMSDFKQVVNHGDFENLIEIRDKNEKVSIYIKQKKRFFTDLLIAVRDENEVNLIWINGIIKPETIDGIKNNYDSTSVMPFKINI